MPQTVIDRTNIDVTDDSGSGTDGTVINAAWVTAFLDEIDDVLDGTTADPLEFGGGISVPATSKVFLDGAGNTYLYEPSADVMAFVCGNIEAGRVTSAKTLFLGGTSNSKMGGAGITIDQEGIDNEAFALKGSTDIAHGRTGYTETDTYATLKKISATLGGVQLLGMAEDAATTQVVQLLAAGGTADTTKTVSAVGLIDLVAEEHDGANNIANITADGNVFTVRAYVAGAYVARLAVDEDGDLYSVTSAQTFDHEDDALMVRALDLVRGDTIRSEWDRYVTHNEEQLIAAGILGGPVADGGMTNTTQLQRLHNGAIWQLYTKVRRLEEQVARLT